jgi:hypothetical protein
VEGTAIGTTQGAKWGRHEDLPFLRGADSSCKTGVALRRSIGCGG